MNWIDINKELPKIVYEEDGSVNCVLVRYKEEYAPEAGSRYQVNNTVYVNKRAEHLTHWCYIEEI